MIRIQNLRKRFTDESDILYQDLTFEDGKSYVLLGASGWQILGLRCGLDCIVHPLPIKVPVLWKPALYG